MSIVLPALAITFAAFCVWLTVRIVNRRERWAKWTLAVAVVGVPVLYVVSFGPWCWWLARPLPPPNWLEGGTVPTIESELPHAPTFYWPLGWLAQNAGSPVADAIRWYATVGTQRVLLPTDQRGTSWFTP